MTELNSQISSRIPNANHNDFLPPKSLRTLVFPTVNILTFEPLDSCGQESIAQALVIISHYFLKIIIELKVHPTSPSLFCKCWAVHCVCPSPDRINPHIVLFYTSSSMLTLRRLMPAFFLLYLHSLLTYLFTYLTLPNLQRRVFLPFK